ncbi:hypothetical protein [Enterococcus sp. DIV0800]|uniref:hypothetical protein n=1 Tax=unclassified Enterococcus TaxID=2608891 RepID=UPI003D2FDA27
MKLRFLGIRTSAVTSGCSSCGNRRSRQTFHREKTMTLPSGIKMYFFIGKEYEVNESDGRFLLDQYYMVNNRPHYFFERVDASEH